MKYTILLMAALLAGCANMPKPTITGVQHHKAPTMPHKSSTVAPKPAVASPTKQSFKDRWLHLFFRDRAK